MTREEEVRNIVKDFSQEALIKRRGSLTERVLAISVQIDRLSVQRNMLSLEQIVVNEYIKDPDDSIV